MGELIKHDETVALASPLPAFSGEQMAHAFRAYKDLQATLDRAMPDQIMSLDGKAFRKKGYWRAIAVAFNLRVESVSEQRMDDGAFDDGRPNFGYRVTYQATAPNGRSATGDGACFAIEKGKRGDGAWKVRPAQATEHNVRSHAHTRAFNRAVSNLCGFGEVSAEEMMHEAAPAFKTAPTPRPQGADLVGILVTRAAAKSFKSKAGKDLTKWEIEFSDGTQTTTLNERMGCDAEEYAKSHRPVEYELNDDKYRNLKSLRPARIDATSGPAQPLDDLDDVPPPSDEDVPF